MPTRKRARRSSSSNEKLELRTMIENNPDFNDLSSKTKQKIHEVFDHVNSMSEFVNMYVSLLGVRERQDQKMKKIKSKLEKYRQEINQRNLELKKLRAEGDSSCSGVTEIDSIMSET